MARMAATITLESVFGDVELGRYPAADGSIAVVPPAAGAVAAVVGFTANLLIATDALDQDALNALIPDGDLSAPLNPTFLSLLETRTGARANNIDVTLLAPTTPSAVAPSWLTETDARDHDRAARSLHYRTDMRVFVGEGALVLLGRGLAGRMEMAFEIDPAYQGRDLGRRLAEASRSLASYVDPSCTHVWAQCAPGNAASLRTLLAAGFVPVGAEALLVRR
jgi:RimJ/RimL family protein N-acetyltransferase